VYPEQYKNFFQFPQPTEQEIVDYGEISPRFPFPVVPPGLYFRPESMLNLTIYLYLISGGQVQINLGNKISWWEICVDLPHSDITLEFTHDNTSSFYRALILAVQAVEGDLLDSPLPAPYRITYT